MTNVSAVNQYQYQHQAVFEMLNLTGYSANSTDKVKNVNIEMSDTDDDVVMLNGDNINVNAKDGNNTVVLNGDNNSLTAGNGNNNIAIMGSNSTAKTGTGDDNILIEGSNINITTSGGDNNWRIYGDNNTVTAGDGKNTIGMIGDTNTLKLGNGLQKIAFWGNYNNISMGAGNSQVMTIDWALKTNPTKWEDLETPWLEELSHYNTSEKVNSNLSYDYTNCTSAIYASLSAEDKEFAETIDLSEKTEKGYAKYVIAGNADGEATLYVFSFRYRGKNYYYPRGHEGEQGYKVRIKDKTIVEEEASYLKYDNYQMNYNKNYEINGITGNNVTFGDGNNTLKWTLQDGENQATFGTAKTGHTLISQQGYTFADVSSHDFQRCDILNRKFYTVTGE